MESSGVPGKIQVTKNIVETSSNDFSFERRGMVSVKGIGEMETFFLTGRKSDDVDELEDSFRDIRARRRNSYMGSGILEILQSTNQIPSTMAADSSSASASSLNVDPLLGTPSGIDTHSQLSSGSIPEF